jgi:hypothetical protein
MSVQTFQTALESIRHASPARVRDDKPRATAAQRSARLEAPVAVDKDFVHPRIRDLHARTWARCRTPTDAEVREAYLAAGFQAERLERALARKERWRSLPEVAIVRFDRRIGGKTDAKVFLGDTAPPATTTQPATRVPAKAK